jgi:polyphosphate glucokinase
MPTVLGVDIGGTGIKAAPVDVGTGELLTDRRRIATPFPSTPDAIAAVVHDVARFFDWTGPTGVAFPAVVKNGIALTASHVDDTFVGVDLVDLLGGRLAPLWVINDADAAGLAEMEFGAGRGCTGVTLMVTVGTGIGTALFVDGILVPNTQLGHLRIRGKDAERRASERIRLREDLSWKQWAARLDEYLLEIDRVLAPDLVVIGGGVSKQYAKFLPRLTTPTRIVPAALRNDAGIVGAAIAMARAQPAAAIPLRQPTG